MGKLLIIIGIVVIIIGLLLVFNIPIPFGRLPGDVSVKGEHVQFYFPLMTCLILSLVISLLYYLFSS